MTSCVCAYVCEAYSDTLRVCVCVFVCVRERERGAAFSDTLCVRLDS